MYSDPNTALEIVKLEAGITTTDRDTVLSNDLEASKGQLNGADEYRPYLVAAIAMHTSKGEQTITEAVGDAKFRQNGDRMNLQPAIEGQLRRQQAFDVALGTKIPAGWDAATWLNALCGCKGDGQASGAAGQNYIFTGIVA